MQVMHHKEMPVVHGEPIECRYSAPPCRQLRRSRPRSEGQSAPSSSTSRERPRRRRASRQRFTIILFNATLGVTHYCEHEAVAARGPSRRAAAFAGVMVFITTSHRLSKQPAGVWRNGS